MANKVNDPCKVITGKCRLSYAHIWEPASINGSDPKFSACILIPKSDKVTLQAVRTAVDTAIQEGVKSKWQGKKPAKLKLPLRDGDEERPDDEAFKDCWFLNANANADRQPGIVDLARKEIKNHNEVYSGCYCRFSINFYPFSTRGNNGVGVGLNHVQKVCDGERLAGGSRAEDDFDDDYMGDDDFDDIM